MENASKALVMAGGILIAIMTISALLYAANSWGAIPKAQDTTDTVKQLTAFNQQYESYAKQAIYGLDLVSVLNKAIDNNEKYGVSPGDRMYVDIIFKLEIDADSITSYYKEYTYGPKKGTQSKPKEKYGEQKFKAGSYVLSENYTELNDFLKTFKDTEYIKHKNDYLKEEDGSRYYLYTKETFATSEFKTRVFECTGTEYDDEGRIKLMKFEEISQTELEERFK